MSGKETCPTIRNSRTKSDPDFYYFRPTDSPGPGFRPRINLTLNENDGRSDATYTLKSNEASPHSRPGFRFQPSLDRPGLGISGYHVTRNKDVSCQFNHNLDSFNLSSKSLNIFVSHSPYFSGGFSRVRWTRVSEVTELSLFESVSADDLISPGWARRLLGKHKELGYKSRYVDKWPLL